MGRDASWWLKVKRAQKHLVDAKIQARLYADSQPYVFERLPTRQGDRQIRHRLRITAEPDPMLALIYGDFVHNLRSALDHVFVACVPKKLRSVSTSFPMTYDDLFARGADGEFVSKDADARENYERALRGLRPEARAVVEFCQAHRYGADASLWILGALTRGDNADKHRQLIATGGGLRRINGHLRHADTVLAELPIHYVGGIEIAFAHAEAVLIWEFPDWWVTPPAIPTSEVDVEYSGTASILIHVPWVGGNQPPAEHTLEHSLVSAIKSVRSILKILEKYVAE
ncbi:MAG: hypothetical protein KJ048_18170 [Dehalococcoidia bacterium]|nr:hypothetical protein [Dehalococcoidia bacterium]